MNDLRPSAVSAGFLLDTVGTWLTVFAIFAFTPGLAGLSEDQQTAFLTAAPAVQVLGALWTVVGGFFAAHLAPAREIPNAFAVGALSSMIGFLSAFSAPSTVPFAYEAVGLAITIPLALVGGWLRVKLPRRGGPAR